MLQQVPLLALGALLLGAATGWALAYSVTGRRQNRALMDAARRLSAAEATTEAERERRNQSNSPSLIDHRPLLLTHLTGTAM